MKKIFLLISALFVCANIFSQEDLIKEIQRLTLINDSLQKKLKLYEEQNAQQTAEFTSKTNPGFQENRNDALSFIVNAYKKPLDELIACSTKESLRRDLQILGRNTEVEQTLSTLQTYFSTKELLSDKYDDSRVKNAQNQLNAIKQESVLLKKLRKDFGNYHICSDGLKKAVERIIAIDSNEIAEGNDFVQREKLNKIISELSQFVFNYDFNLIDYPYLSDIVLEIMKRKQPNADADINDLLNKL